MAEAHPGARDREKSQRERERRRHKDKDARARAHTPLGAHTQNQDTPQRGHTQRKAVVMVAVVVS